MEYVLVSLRLSLVRCIALKMLQVFIRVSGGAGSGLGIPLKITEI